MFRRFTIALGWALLVVAPAIGQRLAAAQPERLEEDSPRATPAGATFTVPAGWTLTTRASMVVLEPPEPDSHVAIVDVKAQGRRRRRRGGVGRVQAGLQATAEDRAAAGGPRGLGGAEGLPVRDLAERAGRRRRLRAREPARRGRSSSSTEPSPPSRSAARRWDSRCRACGRRAIRARSFAGKKANPLDETRLADAEGLRRRAG